MNKRILPFCLLILCSFSPAFAQHLNTGEKKLILSGDTAHMLRVIQVTEPGELRILTSPSIDVLYNDPLLPLLTRRMYKAMRDTANPGIGIAAPQVGINRNVIWVQRFDKEGMPFECYLNPKITWRSKLMRKGKEGCLSIPDIRDDVMRNYTIRLSYQDIQGKTHEEMVEGFTAVIFQHETDHINGILFTDRLKEQKGKLLHPVNDKVDLFLEQLLERQ